MPAGQWVAFDVSTEDQHICGIQNAPDISIKIKGKKKKELQEEDSIDLGYDDSDLEIEEEDDIEEIQNESKIYDTTSGIHKCIDKSIKEKKRILIDYYSEYNEENTQRELVRLKSLNIKTRLICKLIVTKEKLKEIF